MIDSLAVNDSTAVGFRRIRFQRRFQLPKELGIKAGSPSCLETLHALIVTRIPRDQFQKHSLRQAISFSSIPNSTTMHHITTAAATLLASISAFSSAAPTTLEARQGSNTVTFEGAGPNPPSYTISPRFDGRNVTISTL